MAQQQSHKKKRNFWKQIRFKYRLSFLNESTLEEVWTYRLSTLTALLAVILFAFFLIAVTSVLIILTPIRNYLPGYLDVEVRKKMIDNALTVDSLERRLAINTLYLDNVTEILLGSVSLDSLRAIDSLSLVKPDYNIPRSEKEAEYVSEVEAAEKYSLASLLPTPAPTDGVLFSTPVRGVISEKYQPETGHYGIDIVSNPGESILVTLSGTVVFIGDDFNYGNVVHIQHKNGFLSIYKHNELILKKVGEEVVAGEAIAIIGNSGKLSTGPHLHFELWYQGNSYNPEDYIVF